MKRVTLILAIAVTFVLTACKLDITQVDIPPTSTPVPQPTLDYSS